MRPAASAVPSPPPNAHLARETPVSRARWPSSKRLAPQTVLWGAGWVRGGQVRRVFLAQKQSVFYVVVLGVSRGTTS